MTFPLILRREGLRYFNPHFRKGSDIAQEYDRAEDKISIHTSAREVTGRGYKDDPDIFYFNPHFRKGSDQCPYMLRHPPENFNPHFRKGSDAGQVPVFQEMEHFNPHFRKGSDNRDLVIFHCRRNFNPHFRKGSDSSFANVRISADISIHTSAREVTVWMNGHIGIYLDFNPHFRKGSDATDQQNPC